MASLAGVVAAKYSPISGLITDNNYGAYTGNPKLSGAAPPPSFKNPGAPTPAAPGAPPTGVPGSIAGVGAYTPDWTSLIQNDVGLKDAAAALAAGGAANQTQLDAQIANAYETFGKNVDLDTLAKQLGMSSADIQQALTPDAQRLATENTNAGLSTTARLDKTNKDAIRQIIAGLNKRGILHSGEAGHQLDQENLGYRQASSDAYQKLLSYLQQYQQGYVSAQQQNAQSLAGAYSSAADRQYTNNPSSPGVTAQWDHTDANGNAVYRGPNGQLYDANGNPWNPASGGGGQPYNAPAPADVNPVATMAGGAYDAAPAPGAGNLYGTLDPALAGAIVNHHYGRAKAE